MIELSCKSCGKTCGEFFYRVEKTPVNSCLLVASRKEAVNFPSGALNLVFCAHCGFIWNADFDANLIEYSDKYEETQGYSATFSRFHQQLARDLIERYGLHGKRILEIGCGKGEFLQLLCEVGNNTGVGFDPAYVEGRLTSSVSSSLTFIRDFYTEKYADYEADFVCCKMTLEHINEPWHFMQMIRRTIGHSSETIIFFQVPDVGKVIEEGAMEDFYYEHCSYFSHASLGRLFQRCGFAVQSVESVYDQQYLIIEARPTEETVDSLLFEPELESLKQAVKNFRTLSEEYRKSWNERLADWKQKTRKVVIWGSGSKAIGFLTALDNSCSIEYVVDINPNKAGTYTAGTGQEIVMPEFLVEYCPDDIIVMNAIYKAEIAEQLALLGLKPNIHTLR